ncbi:MAG: ABC transporter permease [Verrucomicrobia bacterium]|nr:ABC transporter permease [Verrucomicrobiota bacterium]
MRVFFTLTRRELAGFLVSIAGYVIIAMAVFLMGLSFSVLVGKLEVPTPMPIVELFYMTPFFWLILILSVPVITMRLFALEKYSGTYETLMTTPVGDWQVVLAKFTASLIFYMLMWIPLIGCMYVLSRYSNDAAAFNWVSIGTTYLGIFLVGALFMSVGLLASSLTRNQIVAAMVSLAFTVSVFLLSFAGEKFGMETDWMNEALRYVAMVDHMQDFARGIVDTRQVAFYLTLSSFFLFLTYRVVQSRRWK